MGHRTAKDNYSKLQERLDRMPVGAPGRKTMYEILKVIFTAEEAELASQLPMRLSRLSSLAKRLDMNPDALRARLEKMADKGIVFDMMLGDEMRYTLNPTIVGFFEFSMMRVREDMDQRKLAGLIHRYMLEEPDFSAAFDPKTRTSPFRTMVHEEALPQDFAEILDWERASYLVETADKRAVSTCHCRHVKHHLDQDCPKIRMDVCLTLGQAAEYVTAHAMGRPIDLAEAKDLMAETRDAGLVHIADNVQNDPGFICNCCACCCELLGAFNQFKVFGDAFTSNFEAEVDDARCNACRKCSQACPVDAAQMERRTHVVDGKPLKFVAHVDHDVCLGCGVCALKCETGAMQMVPRERRHITPVNTFARILTMALEQGKLQELIFDQADGMPSQVAGTIAGAVLELPPAKRLLAQEAFKSRFIDFLLKKATSKHRPKDKPS